MDALPEDAIKTLRDLRVLRRRLKLTQVELAGILDLQPCSLRRMELGDAKDQRKPHDGRGRPRRWTTESVLARANALLKRWENYPAVRAEEHPRKPHKCPLCGTDKAA